VSSVPTVSFLMQGKARGGMLGWIESGSVPLVSSVERASSSLPLAREHHRAEAFKRCLGWLEDHDARVEAVWPSGVGRGGERMGERKQMGESSQRKHVRVEKDDLCERGEPEHVQLGEHGSQIRST
jgi:hypothetical protein